MIFDIITSWSNTKGNVNSINQIQKWINELNDSLVINIRTSTLDQDKFWFLDREQDCITNKNNSFFSIKGIRVREEGTIITEQPVIMQNEIGYLGIICKEIDGVLNFLMQAKIEPGNVNKIQLSPTIQATRSNFTRKHGGKVPAYLDYFLNAEKHTILVDQIQSEQSSRFYKKRNRNIIIRVDEEIEVLPNHKWMTLGQIKELLKIDNLVNMDTRTVLSCIPLVNNNLSKEQLHQIKNQFNDKALYESIFNTKEDDTFTGVYKYINDYKMFNNLEVEVVGLSELCKWNSDKYGIRCIEPYSFSVIYCDIEVEGREVRKWTQPLFKAEGVATFGLFTTVEDGIRKFLIKCRYEIGCFDQMELGPTIQLEAVSDESNKDIITELFQEYYLERRGVLYNVILSEEGGRFYHEQNHNIIIEIDKNLISTLPDGYFWMDYKVLNRLVQVNNCLNIQLRNLLALLEV